MSKIELKGDETNAVLASKCDEFGITVEAKDPKKPNKAELIASIEKYNNSIDDEGVETEISEEEYEKMQNAVKVEANAAEETVAAKPKKKAKTRKQLQEELFPLRRVQVTCNDDSQTRTSDQLMFITWGNDVIGHNTDRLLLGRPWHIREGALRNLREQKYMKSVPNPKTGEPEFVETIKYNIVDLGLKSMEEYKEMGKRQAVRDAAVAGLEQ